MIEIKNLEFSYQTNKKLFDDFNLSLEKGKIYGILGRNGSGKTTLLNIIASLLPNYKGSVEINGIESKKRKREYLDSFYYLPENIMDTNFIIKDFLQLGTAYSSWDKEKFLNYLNENNLKLDSKLKSLSKGWRKRLYFYFAISLNPEMMILDEVSEGVDILAQKDIINDIEEYFDENKVILLASHHIEEFEKIIDEYVIIENGVLLNRCNKDFINNNFAWVLADNKESIEKDDILLSKKILGEDYLLVKNRENYTNFELKDIGLATFLRISIEGKVKK